jgi:hypothetical protein
VEEDEERREKDMKMKPASSSKILVPTTRLQNMTSQKAVIIRKCLKLFLLKRFI